MEINVEHQPFTSPISQVGKLINPGHYLQRIPEGVLVDSHIVLEFPPAAWKLIANMEAGAFILDIPIELLRPEIVSDQKLELVLVDKDDQGYDVDCVTSKHFHKAVSDMFRKRGYNEQIIKRMMTILEVEEALRGIV